MSGKRTTDIALPNQSGTSDLYTTKTPSDTDSLIGPVRWGSGNNAKEVQGGKLTYRGKPRSVTTRSTTGKR